MTEEERWRDACAAEEGVPSGWEPSVDELADRFRLRLHQHGCSWADLAVVVVMARSRASVDRASFASRLGLSEAGLRALEGG
ncbi:MAG TPA: hypothetical protein VHC63_17155 [Acidimicrobiales bacterium]|nr:hypothetical protein [Acidimicrobiales bacterium]